MVHVFTALDSVFWRGRKRAVKMEKTAWHKFMGRLAMKELEELEKYITIDASKAGYRLKILLRTVPFVHFGALRASSPLNTAFYPHPTGYSVH